MRSESTELVRASWHRVAPDAESAAAYFYDKLFELDSEARALFARTDMAAQGRKVMAMFAEIVRLLDDPEGFVPDLAALGRRHVEYGARDGDYDSVGAALLWTLERQLGPDFTPEVRDAWAEAYRMMAGVMRRAAARHAGLTGEHRAATPAAM